MKLAKKYLVFLLLSTVCLFLPGLPILPLAAQTISAPTELYVFRNAPSYDEATFYWTDNSQDETGFVIERKADGGGWTEVVTLNENTSQHTLSSLDEAVSADYRIKATNSSANVSYSNVVRLIGTESKLEVYPEVPGIRNPKDTTINGITFPIIQYQTPSDPSQGKATRISTFYRVEVRPASGGDWLYSPTYETRPQVRDLLAQNDPAHSGGGHNVYAYGKYGPNANNANFTLHSRHWNNFDAETDITVRITLLTGALSSVINLAQTEIYPTPLSINQVNDSTLDITLPAAGTGAIDHARHYMLTFNRTAWRDAGRGANIYEHPLMVFVNPVKPNPATAPAGTFKEFDGGKLLVMGPGIHLPNNRWRFLGSGGNNTAEEVYVPGDAYLHGGFVLNNTAKAVRVWGRGIYSDELFLVHGTSFNWSQRTPWATQRPAEGNPWNIKGSWEASIFFKGGNYPQTVEGLSSISRRMGSVTENGGNARLIDHKDVGYAGGLFQKGNSQSYYLGIYTHNDDDITYTHQDFEMEYCTTRNLHNGPSFQFGWGVNDEKDAGARVYHCTSLPADKRGDGYGHNHGVFNSRLQSGEHIQHTGGVWENFHVMGTENIVFNIGISDDKALSNPNNNQVGYFQDKVFKNFTIDNHSRHDNVLQTEVDAGSNQKSYIRFLHFDSLMIEGKLIKNIDDGDYFDYNDKVASRNTVGNNMNGTLLHTITFFSLPDPIGDPGGTTARAGETLPIISAFNKKAVQADASLPASLSPLCANSYHTTARIKVLDAGDGYIALRAPNGYYVKADPERYGYLYTIPDFTRSDPNVKTITEDAKFKWIDLGNDQFALYSKSMGLYVRTESNAGPEGPLYAASDQIGLLETFSTNVNLVSTEQSAPLPQLSLYPNPTSGTLQVDAPITHSSHADVYTLQGQLIQSFPVSPGMNTLDVSTLTKGVYMIKVEGFHDLQKFVKQ